jgi:hypothetical protein
MDGMQDPFGSPGRLRGVRERAPWYRRRLGVLGRVAVALVVASAAVGFVAPATTGWRSLQVALAVGAAVAYLAGLVRSPD